MKGRVYPETEYGKGLFRLLRFFAKHALGPLELQVMSVLWQRGDATVKEVINYGDVRREYSTVMTTLDRLHRKGLLDRSTEPGSRAFRYVPRHHNRAEWECEVATKAVGQLLTLGGEASLPLSHLVEAISEHDPGLLDDLRRVVEEKLQERRNATQ
jgi:predicted transcriptional regulator